MDVSAISGIVHQRRKSGSQKRCVKSRHIGNLIKLRHTGTHLFKPAECAKEDPLLCDSNAGFGLVARHSQGIVDQSLLPGIQAIGAGVEMLGEQPLEPRGWEVFQNIERGQHPVEPFRGRLGSNCAREVIGHA